MILECENISFPPQRYLVEVLGASMVRWSRDQCWW